MLPRAWHSAQRPPRSAMAAGSGPGRILGLFSVACLLLRFGFVSCDLLKLFGTVNKNITLHPPSHTAFKEIMWKKQKDKVVEWEENSKIMYFPPFQDRIHLDTESGDLTIFNLTLSDEDHYEIESPSVKDSTIFSLYVVEPLSPLELNCTLIGGNIIVQCGLQKYPDSHRELIEYSWDCPSEQCENSSESEMHFMNEGDLSKEVHCIVKNPVSKRESSIVLANCALKGHSRHRLLLLVVAASAVLALILLGVKGVWRSGQETAEPSSVVGYRR